MTAPFCPPTNRDFYLGLPPSSVLKLTIPDSGYTDALDIGAVDHALLGGPHGVQRLGRIRRSYGLSFSSMSMDTADQIVSAIDGLLGRGPYYFVDPAWRNLLPSHIAACGKKKASSAGFIPAGSTVAYTTAVTPPAAAPLSGIQLWSGLAAGDALWCNAKAVQLLEASAPPAIAGEPITVAAWMRTVTSTLVVSIGIYFNDAAGAYISTVTAGSAAVTTTFTRFAGGIATGSIPANAATYGIVLTVTSGAATGAYVAAMDTQFVTGTIGTTPSSLPAWVQGIGVPKVSIVGAMPADAGPTFWRRSHGLTFVEAA